MENLYGVFSRLTGQNEEAISEALKDKDEKAVEKLLKDSFSEKIAEAERKARDEGYKKAESIVSSNIEKKYSKQFGVTEFKDLDDLMNKVHISGKEVADLDPSAIRKSETYLTDLKTYKEKSEQFESDLKAFKTEISQRELKQQIAADAFKELEAAFAIPGKEKPKQNFIDDLLRIADFEVIDGERIPLVKGTKERLTDKMKNPMSLKDLYKQLAPEHFEVKGNTPREPAGAATVKPTGKGGKYNIQSVDDFNRLIQTSKTSEELDAIDAEYADFVAKSQ